MDQISPTSFSAAPAAKQSAGTGGNGLASDFDTFLRLLTAQIRNQDPLNPAESTEFVAQLATFSNVEQSVQTNDLLKSIASQMSLQNMGQLASWVGMEARAEMPVQLDGTAQTLHLKTPTVADQANLVVSDAAGREVQRIEIDANAKTLTWSGKGTDGATLPDGIYTLKVESSAGDQMLAATPVETYAIVQEATQANGQVVLMFAGGIAVPSASVQGIRPPQS